MSKQHFEALARIIRECRLSDVDSTYAEGRNDTLFLIAHAIADECASHNPRFNRTRFIEACEVDHD